MRKEILCDARNSNVLTGKVRIKLTSVEDQVRHIPQEEKDKYKEMDPTLFVIALLFYLSLKVVQTPQLLVVKVSLRKMNSVLFFSTYMFSS